MPALEDRISRLEAEAAITQLVSGYAVAYDARDLEALSASYAPQVRASAMAELTAELPLGRTFHLVADPVLTFAGPDSAAGTVVCRAEREEGDQWIVSGVTFSDRYVRVDGSWFLAARSSRIEYAADVLSRP